MGAKASTGKGADLHVGTISLGDTPTKAAGITETDVGEILVGQGTRIVLLDISTRHVSTFAGKQGVGGNSDGHRTDQALFQRVSDMISVNHTTFIVDCDNCKIRSLTDNVVSTFAGTGNQLVQDGPRKEASFFYPISIAHLCGTLFVTDIGASSIRVITPDGNVSTLRNQPDEPKYRWKSLLSVGSSKRASLASSGSSSSPSTKFQSLKSVDDNNDMFFGEEKDGKLKFGKLRALCTGRSAQHIYVCDQLQITGGTLNRVMRFNVAQKEVEMLAWSTVGIEALDSLAQNLHGGNSSVFTKYGLFAAGMCAITPGDNEEFLLSSDPDHHLLWRIGARYGTNSYGGTYVLLGKEGSAHGGSKDGSLKSARVESPSSPLVTFTGDLIWIDTAEKSGSRLRLIKDFGRVVAGSSTGGSKTSLSQSISSNSSSASSTSFLASSTSSALVAGDATSSKTAPIAATSDSTATGLRSAKNTEDAVAPTSSSLPTSVTSAKVVSPAAGNSLSASDFYVLPEGVTAPHTPSSNLSQGSSPNNMQWNAHHAPQTNTSPTGSATPRQWVNSTGGMQQQLSARSLNVTATGQWSPSSSNTTLPAYLVPSTSSSSITASTASLVSSNSVVSAPSSNSASLLFTSGAAPETNGSSLSSSAFSTSPPSAAHTPQNQLPQSPGSLALHRNPSNTDVRSKDSPSLSNKGSSTPYQQQGTMTSAFSAASTAKTGIPTGTEGNNAAEGNSMLLSPSSLMPTSYGSQLTVSISSNTFSLDKSSLMTDWQLIEPNRASTLSVPLSSSPSSSSLASYPKQPDNTAIPTPKYV